jgi:hypothetical protein
MLTPFLPLDCDPTHIDRPWWRGRGPRRVIRLPQARFQRRIPWTQGPFPSCQTDQLRYTALSRFVAPRSVACRDISGLNHPSVTTALTLLSAHIESSIHPFSFSLDACFCLLQHTPSFSKIATRVLSRDNWQNSPLRSARAHIAHIRAFVFFDPGGIWNLIIATTGDDPTIVDPEIVRAIRTPPKSYLKWYVLCTSCSYKSIVERLYRNN